MSERGVVAVTGATGFVGRSVVRHLIEAGYAVRALVRSREKASEVLPEGVELIEGSILDGSSPARLVDGASACIHLIGIIREAAHGQSFKRMHVEAVRAITEACREGDVKRYLHMSALGALIDSRAPYSKTKAEGEQIVRRSGLDWTIFRPGLIHGPDGEFVQMMHAIAAGEAAPWLFMPYFSRTSVDASFACGSVDFVDPMVQPVYVEDVARCFVAALGNADTVEEIYPVVGSESMSWPEMLCVMRDMLPGARDGIQPFHIPGEHAAVIARAAKLVGMGWALPFDAGQALMGCEDSTASTSKMVASLGVEPAGLRASMRGYASRFAAAH